MSSAARTRCPNRLASAGAARDHGVVELRIRPGTADDWATYREIRLRMLAEAPRAYGSPYAHEAAFDEARWRQRAGNPMLVLAYADEVDEPGGRLVGTATGLAEPGGDVMVVAMYVDPDVRGRGCAEQLLDAVAALARARAAARLVLHVTTGNRAATRCYTRYGFTRTGRSWPMERDPELIEIELALVLEPASG